MTARLQALGLVVMFAVSGVAANAASFTDSFEGSALDPYWTTASNDGIVTFPATDKFHSGTQSVEFQLTPTTATGHGAGIYHNYSEPTYGAFEVWIYDRYPGNYNGNYALLFLGQNQANGGKQVSVGIMDWDGSSYWVGGDVTQALPTSRTLGWHRLEIVNLPNQLTVSVDGVVGYSSPNGYAIDTIQLQQYSPNWRPDGLLTNFDDFSAQTVPEPSTLLLIGMGAVSLICVWRRRNRAN